jgi:cephalosporin-C deacetylase
MFPHNLPFDPTYGYSQSDLLAITPPPEHPAFKSFWQDTYAQTRAIPLNLALKTSTKFKSPHHSVFDVEFDSLGGFRSCAWITIPKKPFSRAFVISHGYGGREAPALFEPTDTPAAGIFPCARGFHINAHPAIPSTAAHHVIHGIDAPETYSHRFCIADLWSSASAILEIAPHTASDLLFCGESFGGGIGALALPWEPRFRKAFLAVPSFGHHPLRLAMQCQGSGEAVRIYHKHHPEIAQTTLPFFDSAVAATHIQTPTFCAPALFDPAVPPPGQFAVTNAIANKELFILPAGHFDYPASAATNAQRNQKLKEWFDR